MVSCSHIGCDKRVKVGESFCRVHQEIEDLCGECSQDYAPECREVCEKYLRIIQY
jgi:hypothetical protein